MAKTALKILPLLLVFVLVMGLILANMTMAEAAWPYDFSGYVYDATDNSPLEGVTVKLMQNGALVKTETSDNTGEFTFSNVASGTYKVEVDEPVVIGGLTYVLDSINNEDVKMTASSGINSGLPEVYMKRAYEITVENDGNGTGSASPAQSPSGETITLTATAKAGFDFKEWQVITGGVTLSDASATPATFTMPTGNVTVKAIFEQIPEPPTPEPVSTPGVTRPSSTRSDGKSNTYVIRYYKNIQDGESPFYIQGNYYKGDTTVVTDREPTRKGYRFLYWTPNLVDHGKHYYAGDKIGMHGDWIFYAQWELLPEETEIISNVNDNPSTGR